MDISHLRPLFKAIHELYGFKSNNDILNIINNAVDIKKVATFKTPPLQIACILENPRIIKKLIDNGENINEISKNGSSSLFLMCVKNKSKIVKFLIKNGADINLKHEYGWTSLMISSYKGHIEIIKILLCAGANVNYKLDMINNSPTLSHARALHFACDNNNIETVNLLIEYGAVVNIKTDHDSTPLYIAINKNNTKIVEKLINAYDNIPEHYIEYAENTGDKEIIELLKKNSNGMKNLNILVNTAING
jgi:ankyrin repeat protein